MAFTDRLFQGDVWPTREGRHVSIAQMDIAHVYYCLAYLERNAHRIATSYASQWVFMTAPDDVHAELDRACARPEVWIRSTDVYRALLKRAKAVRRGN